MERMPRFDPAEPLQDEKKTESEKKSEVEKKPDTLLSKLRKLKGAGIAAALIGIASQETPAHAETNTGKETAVRVDYGEYLKKPEFKKTQEGVQAIQKEFGEAGQRSMQQEAAARERAVSDGTARTAAEIIAKLPPDERTSTYEVMALEGMLASVNAQGVVYREFRNRFGHLPKTETARFHYYGSHLRDFAPTSSDIRPEDIDPRLRIVSDESATKSVWKTHVAESPGWSGGDRTAVFKRLVDDQDIRKMATASDLTIAEYLSLIKAVSKEVDALKTPEGRALVQADPSFAAVLQADELKLSPERTAELVAKVLLEKREQFSKAEVLGPSTNDFIIMTGRDSRKEGAGKGGKNAFDPNTWLEVAKAAKVPDSAVHAFDASTQAPGDVLTRTTDAISASSGETVIAFDTHGAPEDIAISVDDDSKLELRASTIAQALAKRLVKSKDKESLSHVTVVVDSCNGYEFAQKLSLEIRRAWNFQSPSAEWASNVTSKDIAMPRIITTAQEGSYGVIGQGAGSELRRSQLQGIKKEGAVTGKRLLQNVQPRTYQYNDMTFFLPEHGGLLELGANEKEKDSAPT